VNCRDCRAAMCTEGLLSKLRCADCRQIEFERFRAVALKAGLIVTIGCLAVNLLVRSSDLVECDPLTDVDRRAA
jgi:hypothetical protein